MTDRELMEAAAKAVSAQVEYSPVAAAYRAERGYSPTHGRRAAAAMVDK